jgi:hypothetical protein
VAARRHGEGKTPHRTIRAEDDVWDAFGDAVARQGEPDRSTVLRAFMTWYVRLPGAKMPQRPPAASGE